MKFVVLHAQFVNPLLNLFQEVEEGESQLMPTSSSSQASEGVSPPKKVPRGPLPRSVARGVVDDKARKQRSKCTFQTPEIRTPH